MTKRSIFLQTDMSSPNKPGSGYPITAHLWNRKTQARVLEEDSLERAVADRWLKMLYLRGQGEPRVALDNILGATTSAREAELISGMVQWLVWTTVGSKHLTDLIESVGGQFTAPMSPHKINPEHEEQAKEFTRIAINKLLTREARERK